MLLLLVVASYHGASGRGTFLPSRHHGKSSLLASVVGLRGGRGFPVKKEVSPTGVQKLKLAAKQELGRPQDAASRALVSTILLYIGAMFTVYAMNIIQKLLVTDGAFWSGTPVFGRSGAYKKCHENKSVLFDFPSTVSEALSNRNEITNIVVGSYLTFTALLVLASKMGNPSAFPIPAGHYRTIFNALRMLTPVFATFFVPRISAPGSGDKSATPESWAQIIEAGLHTKLALVSFFGAPLFEIISATIELISFFCQRPFGSKFLPLHSSDSDKGEDRSTIVDTFYKSLWVLATVARAVLGVLIIHVLVSGFNPAYAMPAQIDACGSLRSIKTFVNEKSLIGMIGGMFVSLAVSQMCESSGRKISSLLYILPLLVFASKGIWKHVSAYLMTFDLKKNYLELAGIPSSGFWSEQDPIIQHLISSKYTHAGLNWEELAKCTALLDLGSIPDNCFELKHNPQ